MKACAGVGSSTSEFDAEGGLLTVSEIGSEGEDLRMYRSDVAISKTELGGENAQE